MPNHVESVIQFKGKSSEVNRILKQLEYTHTDQVNRDVVAKFSFNPIIPQPLDLGDDWYDWCCENWGTKWDAYDVRVKIATSSNAEKFILGDSTSTARIYFNTAWSPVPKVLSRLSEMFPETEFRYAYLDEGMGFAGTDSYLNGEGTINSDDIASAKRFLRSEPVAFKRGGCYER